MKLIMPFLATFFIWGGGLARADNPDLLRYRYDGERFQIDLVIICSRVTKKHYANFRVVSYQFSRKNLYGRNLWSYKKRIYPGQNQMFHKLSTAKEGQLFTIQLDPLEKNSHPAMRLQFGPDRRDDRGNMLATFSVTESSGAKSVRSGLPLDERPLHHYKSFRFRTLQGDFSAGKKTGPSDALFQGSFQVVVDRDFFKVVTGNQTREIDARELIDWSQTWGEFRPIMMEGAPFKMGKGQEVLYHEGTLAFKWPNAEFILDPLDGRARFIVPGQQLETNFASTQVRTTKDLSSGELEKTKKGAISVIKGGPDDSLAGSKENLDDVVRPSEIKPMYSNLLGVMEKMGSFFSESVETGMAAHEMFIPDLNNCQMSFSLEDTKTLVVEIWDRGAKSKAEHYFFRFQMNSKKFHQFFSEIERYAGIDAYMERLLFAFRKDGRRSDAPTGFIFTIRDGKVQQEILLNDRESPEYCRRHMQDFAQFFIKKAQGILTGRW